MMRRRAPADASASAMAAGPGEPTKASRERNELRREVFQDEIGCPHQPCRHDRRSRSSSGSSVLVQPLLRLGRKGPRVRVMAGAFEREAIRPHVLGRFADMLKAVEQHPAMLIYLDNAQSIGPNSRPAATAGAGSTRTSRARSWNCTRSASMAATARPT